MKYTIEGFSQELLIENDLDVTDALILRWFLDFRTTDKMVRMSVEGQDYYWIFYDKIIDDLPIINIKKRALAERMMKMANNGILTHKTVKNAMGTYSAYNVTYNLLNLLYENKKVDSIGNNLNVGGSCLNDVGGSCLNDDPVAVQTTTKDSSIINSSIKNINIGKNEKNPIIERKNEVQESIIEYWNLQPELPKCRKVTDKIITVISNRLKDDSKDEIISIIDKYHKVLSSNGTYYFNYHWDIQSFFKQDNAYLKFRDQPISNFLIGKINSQKKNEVNSPIRMNLL